MEERRERKGEKRRRHVQTESGTRGGGQREVGGRRRRGERRTKEEQGERNREGEKQEGKKKREKREGGEQADREKMESLTCVFLRSNLRHDSADGDRWG